MERLNYLKCECRKDFTNYADVCFKEFGDRVLYWTTVNEPNVFAVGGYDEGIAPPQRCSSPFGHFMNCTRGKSTSEPYLVVHHILLAHSSAVELYRRKYRVYHLSLTLLLYRCLNGPSTCMLKIKHKNPYSSSLSLLYWILIFSL